MTAIYRFGEFRLDPAARTLEQGGLGLNVASKVFDCIVYLLEHRERAVGRDELIAAVWGKIDVGDSVLGQTILQARRTCADTGHDQRVIRTLPRFGYQWVAEVEIRPGGSADAPADARTGPANASAATPHVARRRIALIAALLTAIAIGAWLVVRDPLPPSGSGEPAAARIAMVLPVSVVDAEGPAWMRLGLMDYIAARLRKAGLAVVPSDNVVALTQGRSSADFDADEAHALATTVDAAIIVSASVESNDGHWRIVLRALDASGDAPIVQGDSTDPIVAAGSASDALLSALGMPVARDPRAPGHGSTAALIQQIEAALLSDRIDAARALAATATTAQRADPELRFLRGRIEFESGQMAAARSAFESLLDSAPASREPVLRGRVLSALGAIAMLESDPDAAMPLLDSATELLSGRNEPRALGKALNNRSGAQVRRRDYDAALADLSRARIAMESAGDRLGVAVIDSNLGAVDMIRGHFAEALPVLERSADRFIVFNAHAAELNARTNLVLVRLALLEPAAALDEDARVRELIAQVPDAARRRTAELARAEALYANGRLDAGAAVLADLEQAGAADEDAGLLGRIAGIRVRELLAEGRVAEANRLGESALQGWTIGEDPREFADTWLAVLRAHLAVGHDAEAARDLRAALAWTDRDRTAGIQLRVLLGQAELAIGRKQDAVVEDLFERALARAEHERVPADLVETARRYATWLIEKQRLAHAALVAGRVAPWANQDFDAALLQARLYHAMGRNAAWHAALARARALAGERALPDDITRSPG